MADQSNHSEYAKLSVADKAVVDTLVLRRMYKADTQALQMDHLTPREQVLAAADLQTMTGGIMNEESDNRLADPALVKQIPQALKEERNLIARDPVQLNAGRAHIEELRAAFPDTKPGLNTATVNEIIQTSKDAIRDNAAGVAAKAMGPALQKAMIGMDKDNHIPGGETVSPHSGNAPSARRADPSLHNSR